VAESIRFKNPSLMNIVTIPGHVSDDRHLSAQVPDSIPPGPVTIVVIPVREADEAEEAWMAGIAREWADELADPRQDIYTLDDGEPVDAG
jgi:hypothetical protein